MAGCLCRLSSHEKNSSAGEHAHFGCMGRHEQLKMEEGLPEWAREWARELTQATFLVVIETGFVRVCVCSMQSLMQEYDDGLAANEQPAKKARTEARHT